MEEKETLIDRKPLEEELESGNSKRVCPFKHSSEFVAVPKRTRVEEPGCEIGTNGRTFHLVDEGMVKDSALF